MAQTERATAMQTQKVSPSVALMSMVPILRTNGQNPGVRRPNDFGRNNFLIWRNHRPLEPLWVGCRAAAVLYCFYELSINLFWL